ncbi:DUF4062 domain-containing protein [Brucella anthropi]|uniref:DUF4062 domain-containing protein n=1 Tax=Brucella anthropi TaxID=529 RepID=UPI000F68F1DC|nr:DUF4062 domain-containing protein [Brucella anthropi]RRY13232.1 DUF4062 domain-containing protein [Brucella anthropi]
MQTIRYQVFVSSTFTDLKEERAEVIQALWEMDCIPTGMEAFVASNEDQWKVIQRVIDDSDYYVLIIGGRYGSVANEGISYTEKEYRYAKEIGLPVLAFVHENPEEIPAGKSEKDDDSRRKLEAFRSEVMKEHPVRKWKTPQELGGVASRSLLREIKISQRPGWVRNDGSSPIALLEQVNSLSEENRKLRELIKDDTSYGDTDSLEQGGDLIKISGIITVEKEDSFWHTDDENWDVEISWDNIFTDIGPATINEASETELKKILAGYNKLNPAKKNQIIQAETINPTSWNEILIQLRALGFIEPGTKKRAVSDRNSYWKITPKGDKHLVSLLARRRLTANGGVGLRITP